MNFDDIFLTKSEYRTLKLYAKNFYPKNQLPEYTNSLILKGLVETAHATDTETSERFIVCRITEQGIKWLKLTAKERNKTIHDWINTIIALGALIVAIIALCD